MPQPGVYFIKNTVNTTLAVNYNGPNNQLTVELFNGELAQQWRIVGPPGGMQSIAPMVREDLQTSPRGNLIAPDPPPFQWNIVNPGGQSTITWVQPPQPQLWSIFNVAPGEIVTLAEEGAPNQVWIFENAN